MVKLLWPVSKKEIERFNALSTEMYEALKHMLYVFDKGFEAGTIGGNVCKEAKQAIKKAEEGK